MGAVRILVVDDHQAVRAGICLALARHSGWEVCGQAVDGWDAIEKAKSLRPDVIVLDVRMPNLDGLEAAPLIKKELPESAILIVSEQDPELVLDKAIQAGACGFVSKFDAYRQLVPALERVLQR